MAEHAGDNVSFIDFINEMFYVSHHAHTFYYGRYGSFSMIFCLIVFLLTLIGENQVVVTGARAGLMLWFHDVLPLLLPFMLLSNLFVLKIRTKKTGAAYAIPVLFLLGLLCGYPLGAKMASDFTKEGYIKSSTATILLPLCNNISPMFLSGYIGHTVLQDQFPFWFLLAVLYVPYVLVTSIAFLILHTINKHKQKFSNCNKHMKRAISAQEAAITHHSSNPTNQTSGYLTKYIPQQPTSTQTNDLLLQSVIQITYVGLYIMICSILFALVCAIPSLPSGASTVLCGILEITQGSTVLAVSTFSPAIKTALILACTSFGGISAFLQTLQVTKQSGLSMIYYFVVKCICGYMTGLCMYLLLV